MKRLARETENTTRDIVATATNHLPPAAAVKMPGLSCLKQTTRREKNRANPIQLRQPASLQDLDIPDDLVQLPNGERFLLFDSGPEAGNRRQAFLILLFIASKEKYLQRRIVTLAMHIFTEFIGCFWPTNTF